MGGISEILNSVTELAPILNGAVVAALAVFVIPKYLREQGTGQYRGFRHIVLFYIYAGWMTFCALNIVPKYGFSSEALLRTAISSLIPFTAAFVWVKLTDIMDWDKTQQTRK